MGSDVIGEKKKFRPGGPLTEAGGRVARTLSAFFLLAESSVTISMTREPRNPAVDLNHHQTARGMKISKARTA